MIFAFGVPPLLSPLRSLPDLGQGSEISAFCQLLTSRYGTRIHHRRQETVVVVQDRTGQDRTVNGIRASESEIHRSLINLRSS